MLVNYLLTTTAFGFHLAPLKRNTDSLHNFLWSSRSPRTFSIIQTPILFKLLGASRFNFTLQARHTVINYLIFANSRKLNAFCWGVTILTENKLLPGNYLKHKNLILKTPTPSFIYIHFLTKYLLMESVYSFWITLYR